MGSTSDIIGQILPVLLSANNERRKAAEQALAVQISSNADAVISGLVNTLRCSQTVTLRSMSAVLLRRYLTGQKNLWENANKQTKEALQNELVSALIVEPNRSVRAKLADTIGDLALMTIEDGEWPLLMPMLSEWASSQDYIQCENSLRILATLSPYISSSMQDHLGQFKALFLKCLQSKGEKGIVRCAALRACGQLLTVLTEAQRNQFRDLVPIMLQALSDLLSIGLGHEATEILEILIELATDTPRLFSGPVLLPSVTNSMCQIILNRNLEDRVRHLAVEFLISYSEAAPILVRKLSGNVFVKIVVPAVLELLTECDDEDGDDADGCIWSQGVDEDALDDTSVDVGIEAVERLGAALRTKKFVPIIMEEISRRISSTNSWKSQHAALMALSQIGEVLPDDPNMHAMLLGKALDHFTHNHPRVRYAAIHVLGTFSQDLGPLIQSRTHARVFPSILTILQDSSHPRVQAHGLGALGNYVDMCSEENLKPYLQGLLHAMTVLIQTVKEHAVSAVSSLADRAGESFLPFYDTFVPALKLLFSSCANTKERRMLRGKVLECISLIGMAVGVNKFRQDAMELMQVMVQQKQAPTDPSDPLISYMLQAWGRIGSCLGADFAPYLGLVVPDLFAAAGQSASRVLTAQDMEDMDESDQANMAIYETDEGVQMVVRTESLEDKATACKMLACFVADMKGAYAPYVDQTVALLGPMIVDAMFDDIKLASIAAMPDLLRVARLASTCETQRNHVKEIFNFALEKLLLSMKNDDNEIELILTLVQAVTQCILAITSTDPKVVGELAPFQLNTIELELIANELQHTMQRSFQRRAVAHSKMDDFDEEAMFLLEERTAIEEELQFQIADCAGNLFRTHHEIAMPAFVKHLWPIVQQMAHSSCLEADRKHAMYILDDVIEHGGSKALAMYNEILPLLLDANEAKEPSVRQAAVFGIGMASKLGGKYFAPALQRAIQQLATILQNPDAHSEANAVATDNAVSALGNLCEFQGQDQMYSMWLHHQPLRADLEEARTVCAQLVRLVQAGNETLVSDALIPQVAKVLLNSFAISGIADGPLTKSISSLLCSMRTRMNQDQAVKCFSNLTPQEQDRWQRVR